MDMISNRGKACGRWTMSGTPEQVDSEEKPHFYMIFFPELHSELLPLPRDFLKHIELGPRRPASLVGPSENVWSVMLLKDANDVSVQDGWQEFVADHSISKYDFLLFRYDGDLRFTVRVYDKSACEKEAAFHARPTQVPIKVPDGACAKRRKETPEANLLNSQDCDDVGFISGSKQNLARKGKKGSQIDTGNTERALVVLDEPSGPFELSHMERAPYVAPKKIQKKEMVTESGRSLCLKPLISSTEQCFLFPMHSTACLYNHLPASKQDLDNPPTGSLVSHRRPVADHEIRRTIDAARSFTSMYPSTMVVMKKAYVYRGFCLTLPKPFIRAHLGHERRKLKLWDSCGAPWLVNYVCSQGRGSFSGGWNAFSQGNNLELGDVCVFELIRKNELQVHIFRVVEEVTPLTRVASRLLLEGAAGDQTPIL